MKYFLILFSLFLLTACGETDTEKRQRKQRERIETARGHITEPSKVETVETVEVTTEEGTIRTNSHPDVIRHTNGLSEFDYVWTEITMSGRLLKLNDKFTMKTKISSNGHELIYSLYLNNVYTKYYVLDGDFDGLDRPIIAIAEFLMKRHKEGHKITTISRK
jgi:hypothetical protein